MRQRPGPATPECANAESLAAYSDKSLAASERERLETHFADCMRCQVLLADIARAEGRDPKSASEIPWYRRWSVAIPALAAVAAVAVFVSIRRPANDESQREQPVTIAKNEAPVTAVDAAKPLAPAAPAAAPVPRPAAPPASNELAMTDTSREMAPRAQAMGAAVPRTTAKSASAPAAGAGDWGHGSVGFVFRFDDSKAGDDLAARRIGCVDHWQERNDQAARRERRDAAATERCQHRLDCGRGAIGDRMLDRWPQRNSRTHYRRRTLDTGHRADHRESCGGVRVERE